MKTHLQTLENIYANACSKSWAAAEEAFMEPTDLAAKARAREARAASEAVYAKLCAARTAAAR